MNTVALTILTFQHVQCLHLMHVEVVWVLVSLGTQVQRQIILDPDYLPDYLFVYYDYALFKADQTKIFISNYFQESILKAEVLKSFLSDLSSVASKL